MIRYIYDCNLCNCEIQGGRRGTIDGQSLRFTEKVPGISELEHCPPQQGDVHVCPRCWDAIVRLKPVPLDEMF